MGEHQDSLNALGVLGLVRILTGEFELDRTATGDFGTGEAKGNAVHILGQLFGREIALDLSGQNESVAGHHGIIGRLVIHSSFLLIKSCKFGVA